MTRIPASDERLIVDALKEHGTVTPNGVQVSGDFFGDLSAKLNEGQRTLSDLINDMAEHAKSERERKQAEAGAQNDS